MSPEHLKVLQKFDSLSLSELNESACYLKRIDTKYLCGMSDLHTILGKISKDFKVLEIDKKREFYYDNVYMDTENYDFYYEHQNKKAERTKIRTRHYTDSGDLAFFEYKYKKNGVTQKFRYQFPAFEHGNMTKGKERFFEWIYQSIYTAKAPKITPAIRTKYNRITLVEKSGNERLTIDFNVSIQDMRNDRHTEMPLENLVIVESKSLSKKCKSAKIMKELAIKKAKSCSKYSLWVVYSGLAEKWSQFEHTIFEIHKIRMDVVNTQRNIFQYPLIWTPLTEIQSDAKQDKLSTQMPEQVVVDQTKLMLSAKWNPFHKQELWAEKDLAAARRFQKSEVQEVKIYSLAWGFAKAKI